MFLQEVWVHSDAALLRAEAAKGALQHAVHFQGGAIGAGLLVLSRHPILEVSQAEVGWLLCLHEQLVKSASHGQCSA